MLSWENYYYSQSLIYPISNICLHVPSQENHYILESFPLPSLPIEWELIPIKQIIFSQETAHLGIIQAGSELYSRQDFIYLSRIYLQVVINFGSNYDR